MTRAKIPPKDPTGRPSADATGALSQDERWAAFQRIADPASPDYVPYYDRPENRAEWNAIKSLVDAFGTHLICPRTACRRAGACGDERRRDLPFCFWHYRGSIRFVLMSTLDGMGHKGGGTGLSEIPEGETPFPEPKPPVGPSLLARLQADGVPIGKLCRPIDAGEDPWGWEQDESARETYARLVADGRRRGGLPPGVSPGWGGSGKS